MGTVTVHPGRESYEQTLHFVRHPKRCMHRDPVPEMTLPPIDGQTQLVGLVGWPVGHSASPAMQNAAFDACGLNWRYVPLPVAPGRIRAGLEGLAALGFRGANVTVPHKRAVLPALTTVAPDARALGAVNTVVVEESGTESPVMRGDNTDATGFIESLQEGGFDPEGASIVVVGAGGGARAVVFGLAQAGARNVVILNRSLERATTLVSDLKPYAPSVLEAESLGREQLVENARGADLLVNATPLGMVGQEDTSIWPDELSLPSHLTVFDLVYNPRQTKLLGQARRGGADVVDGLGMLVRQGALAFEMWTGQEAPVEVMRSAGEGALR